MACEQRRRVYSSGGCAGMGHELFSDRTAPDFPFHPLRKNHARGTQSRANFMPGYGIRQAGYLFFNDFNQAKANQDVF